MTNNDIRNILSKLENRKQELILEEVLTDGVLSDMWDNIKALFGDDEAKGRKKVLSVAQLMRKRFKEYLGPRKEQITDNNIKPFLFNWLTKVLKYDAKTLEKAAALNDFSFNKKKNNTSDEGSSSSNNDEEDLFASFNYYNSDILKEDISLNNTSLDKFFVSLITVAEDNDEQSPFVSQRLGLEGETQNDGSNDNSSRSSNNDSSSSSSNNSDDQPNFDDMLAIDKDRFLSNFKKLGYGSNLDELTKYIKNKRSLSDILTDDTKIRNIPAKDQLAGVGFILLRLLNNKTINR